MVVFGAFYDFLGAVGLLGDDEASDGVWENEIGEAPDKVGFVADFVGEAVSAADENDYFATICEGVL